MKELDIQHPDYRDRSQMWQRYWDFYVGGEQLRRSAGNYLVRRQKEPSDVYSERISRVFYENYLGSCIDWYAATLFRSHPRIAVETSNAGTREFFTEFIEDCDRRGTDLLDAVRQAFIQALVFRESYFLVDFPRAPSKAGNRAEEDAIGASRAYLAPFSPQEVTNWRKDECGDYEWVVLRTERTYQESVEQRELVRKRRWAVYDRETFRIYERVSVEGGAQPGSSDSEGEAVLVDEGRHALADLQRVPIVKLTVTDGLWLANKAALLQQEHFNKSNALSWALHMGLFAMPVVYSEREWQQIVGEAYYIQLGPNDRFGWTEPEGHVFQLAADNLDRLKDEIYRVCYLMTQAGGREARHLGQSGDSKRRDFAVTHEVLRAYGGLVKELLRRVLRLIAEARRDEVSFEISGMDQFDVVDFGEELESASRLRALEIPSKRLEREIQKRVALQYLGEMSQSAKNEVVREIEEQR